MKARQLTLTRLALVLAAATVSMMLTAPLATAEVYKWVDKDGVTHYADRPMPGATEVKLPPAQTYQAPAAAAGQVAVPAALPPAPADATTRDVGQACELRSPKDNDVLVNVQSIVFTFAGPEGSTPVLVLNNKRYNAQNDANSIVVQPAPRGAYEAKLTFLNGRREVVCKVPPVTFFVRQPSVLRNRPNR